jgi:heat shock protein HslJ
MRMVSLGLIVLSCLALSVGCKSKPHREYGLAGTSWRLLDLGTEPVMDIEVLILFRLGGLVQGKLPCNQFQGTYRMDGSELTFGPLVTTRMMCDERLMDWEQRILAALEAAERWELMGNELWVQVDGMAAPLRLLPSH